MTTPQMRSSQLVTTFGPGAMVDLPDESVIVAGLDHWSYETNNVPGVHEPRLVEKIETALQRTGITLRRPPPMRDRAAREFHPTVTAFEFPDWFVAQKVERVAADVRRQRLVPRRLLEKGKFLEGGKGIEVVPIRFVRACTKGHVADIDWSAFVHGEGSPCTRPLWIEESGTSGVLEAISIRCECGVPPRALSQAARRELRALGVCNGARPWLGPGTRERCGEPNRLLIRSASNAYFPQILSVISIPDSRSPIDDQVRALWDDFLSDVETHADLVKARKKPTVLARLQGLNDADVMASIARVRAGGQESRSVKEVEFDALADAHEETGSDKPDGVFYARHLPPSAWARPWMNSIEKVVLVHRLREVVAQLGFTRFEAASPDKDGELAIGVKRAPLAVDANWLPAIENQGEGVFLQFDAGAVKAWIEREQIKERGRLLEHGFSLWKKEHDSSKREFFGLPYVMLHSLSHLLMTSIALECGYPASSIRERIYAMDGKYGILLYTGTPDAEGTLGGLILAARDIARHMRRALELGHLCSNDPVCAAHHPKEHDQRLLVGAACHGCLLIAETSCEQHNDFLDRALVVPTVDTAQSAFFGDTVAGMGL